MKGSESNAKIWHVAPKVTKDGKGTGVRLDMHVYVYPDGHGNLHSGGTNHPVDSSEQAIEVLARTWKSLRLAAKRNAKARHL